MNLVAVLKNDLLLHISLQNSIVAGEVGGLVGGINGATVLSVFSSSLSGSFLIPRIIPATAALFSEPNIASTSRQSESNLHPHSCPRPVIRVGETLKRVQNKISPLTEIYSRVSNRFSRIASKISTIKSNISERLRLTCLLPKIFRPFMPILEYTRCKLGLNEDGFMKTPPCQENSCVEPNVQDRPISRDMGIPNFDVMTEGKVSTLDECFPDMEKIEYGARVIAKLVDDQSCDDARYSSICQEALQENRTVSVESCQTQK